jgi:hypothetical protein
MGLYLGGIANGFNGFMQGMDQQSAREQLAKDREFQQSQRQVTLDQQARDRDLLSQMRSVNPNKEVPVDDGSDAPQAPASSDASTQAPSQQATAAPASAPAAPVDNAPTPSVDATAIPPLNPNAIRESRDASSALATGKDKSTPSSNLSPLTPSSVESQPAIPKVTVAPTDSGFQPPPAGDQASPASAPESTQNAVAQQPQAKPKTRFVPKTQDEMAQEYAQIAYKAGKPEEAIKYIDYANKVAFERSTRQFAQIDASAEGKSTAQLAQQVQQVFHDDPMFGTFKITGVDPKTGAVTILASNKNTGYSTTKTFTNPGQLMDSMRAYYTPDMFNQMRQAAASAKYKQMSEHFNLKAGEVAFDGTGRLIGSNTQAPKGFEWVKDQFGNNTGELHKMSTGDGEMAADAKVAAAEARKKADKDVGYSIIKDSFKDQGDAKNIGPATSIYENILANSNDPGMTPQTAAGIAMRAVQAGTPFTETLDPATGYINQHLPDYAQVDKKTGLPSGQATNTNHLIGSRTYSGESDPISAVKMKEYVNKWTSSLPKNELTEYQSVTTPEGAAKYNTAVAGVIDKVKQNFQAERSAAKNSQEQESALNKYQAAMDKIAADQRKVNLFRQFYTPPPAPTQADSSPGIVNKLSNFIGGIGSAVGSANYRSGSATQRL